MYFENDSRRVLNVVSVPVRGQKLLKTLEKLAETIIFERKKIVGIPTALSQNKNGILVKVLSVKIFNKKLSTKTLKFPAENSQDSEIFICLGFNL
jgi:hypothetical protein